MISDCLPTIFDDSLFLSDCITAVSKYSLSLSEKDFDVLLKERRQALLNTGRVEFGSGVIPKLIYAFCDSPFIRQSNLVSSLCDIQSIFYYLKQACIDRKSDDEIIEMLAWAFNGPAGGDIDRAGEIVEAHF